MLISGLKGHFMHGVVKDLDKIVIIIIIKSLRARRRTRPDKISTMVKMLQIYCVRLGKSRTRREHISIIILHRVLNFNYSLANTKYCNIVGTVND